MTGGPGPLANGDALDFAVQCGRVDHARTLMDQGVDVRYRGPTAGQSGEGAAAMGNFWPNLKLLGGCEDGLFENPGQTDYFPITRVTVPKNYSPWGA